MSVLDTLKSLIGGAKKDIDKNLTKEAESVEEAADSIQTSSEEEIEVKSDSETISEEEPLEAEAPAEEEEAPEEEAPEEVEAEEAPVEEEAVEEAVEEVPEEEVSLDEEEESIDDKLSEDEESLEAAEEAVEEEASEENEESDNMTLLKENDIYSMDDIDKEFTQKFRQIVRKCLLGLREEVVSDPALWMCTTCYTCQERCPRSVKIVDIIKMARNEAAKAGYMADAHKATGSYVIKFGHGVPINDKTKDLRKAIGLDELPPTVHAFPEALEEVQKICAACEFDKLIGFNMETGELE